MKLYGSGYDVIHASPPCQQFSSFKHMNTPQPDLIEATRNSILETGKPYIIENVPKAPLKSPTMLCGTMFGLEIRRHRIFETNWNLQQPCKCNHRVAAMNPFNGKGRQRMVDKFGKEQDMERHWKNHIGLNWMQNRAEWREAIPPAYTKFIGEQLNRAPIIRK